MPAMGEHSTTRSRLYQLLAATLAFPSADFYDSVRDGSQRTALLAVVASLPYALSVDNEAALLPPPDSTYEAFQADYIQHFEVGTAGPPCPLYGGVYMGGRTQVWEELIRFYNHFGLHLAQGNRDLPDHLGTELEFLHYLAYREAEAESQESVAALRRAQRDFLAHHPTRWLGLLTNRVAKKGAPPFYQTILRLTESFVQTDLRYLEDLVGRERGQSALVGRQLE